MIIDSHQYFWRSEDNRTSLPDHESILWKRDFLPDALQSEINKSPIEGTIVIQSRKSEEETHTLSEFAASHEYIKAVIGWVDLQSDELPEKLDEFRTIPVIKGFRHPIHEESSADFILNPIFMRGVKVLRVFGYSFDIPILPLHLSNTIDFARQMPDINMIVNPIGWPIIDGKRFQDWESQVRILSNNKYVYWKLSSVNIEAIPGKQSYENLKKYIDLLLEAFGPERLLFASNWPICLQFSSYRDSLEVIESQLRQLSENDQLKIMGLNALKVYDID